MAETKVTVRLPIRKQLLEMHTNKVSKELGELIIEQARELISKGQSPVDGVGRFEEYSGARNRRSQSKSQKPKGYPYNVQKQYPDKNVRPVNLELSGEMLDALEVKVVDSGPRIGIFRADMAERARKHNLGDPAKGVPERHFWPTRGGEKFTVSIQREIKNFYAVILNKILKESN